MRSTQTAFCSMFSCLKLQTTKLHSASSKTNEDIDYLSCVDDMTTQQSVDT